MPKRKQPDEFHFWFFNKNIAADALHPCSAMSVSHFRRRSSQIPYRMARYERRPRRRRSPGLPRGGCLRPEMRLGHHLLRACRGWQAARNRHIEVKGRIQGATTVSVTKTKSSRAGIREPNTISPSCSSVQTTPLTARTMCRIPSRRNPAGACPPSTTTSKRCSHAPRVFRS